MKCLFRLIFLPVRIVLTLLVWMGTFALNCGAFIFGLAGAVVAFLGLAVLCTYSVQNGLILLCIAFLVSPFGLPMLAAFSLGFLSKLNAFFW